VKTSKKQAAKPTKICGLNFKANVEKSHAKIKAHLNYTRVVRWKRSALWLKMESEQVTGSFKARGGGYRVLSLSKAQRAKGVTTASTGNHGAGVAHMSKCLNVPLTVYVPKTAKEIKLAKIRNAGAKIEKVDGDCGYAEVYAREIAEKKGQVFVSPYNDPVVVTGQGTIGKEILEQIEGVEVIYIAVGGGGLIGGIGGYIKSVRPEVEIVGVLPAFAPIMFVCMKVGKIIDCAEKPTLSDATAGNLEPGSITLPICQ